MKKTIETLAGDTPGHDYWLNVFTFAGREPGAPSAYLQAALHGNELPGVAALHVLIPMLAAAEAEGRLRGNVTVVPFANPIGLSQFEWGEQQGRFALASRVNFNRDFPLISAPDLALITDDAPGRPVERRMKGRLLKLALGHDIILDLHCDDQSLSYFYAPAPLWPHMADLAACLDSRAVLLFTGGTDASFDEASFHPYENAPADVANLPGRVVATVELRGRLDVDAALAGHDGAGLYRFLVRRGIVEDGAVVAPAAFSGPAVLQSCVEMVRAPRGGMVLFYAAPGEEVAAGQRVAEIVARPGEADGTVEVRAEAAGLVLTRVSTRAVRVGDDLMKIVGDRPSRSTRAGGALED